MSHWTSEEWQAIITLVFLSLTRLLVGVIDAWKGHADRREIKLKLATVEERQRAHEQNAERRSRVPKSDVRET